MKPNTQISDSIALANQLLQMKIPDVPKAVSGTEYENVLSLRNALANQVLEGIKLESIKPMITFKNIEKAVGIRIDSIDTPATVYKQIVGLYEARQETARSELTVGLIRSGLDTEAAIAYGQSVVDAVNKQVKQNENLR